MEMSGETLAALEGDFRAAMRLLASGVALVTTCDDKGAPCGIAMTAFMSLSMEPPSLLLAINRTAGGQRAVRGQYPRRRSGRGLSDLRHHLARAALRHAGLVDGGRAAACGILRCHYPVSR